MTGFHGSVPTKAGVTGVRRVCPAGHRVHPCYRAGEQTQGRFTVRHLPLKEEEKIGSYKILRGEKLRKFPLLPKCKDIGVWQAVRGLKSGFGSAAVTKHRRAR